MTRWILLICKHSDLLEQGYSPLSELHLKTRKIILTAGKMLKETIGDSDKISVRTKSTDSDLVTQLDTEIENFLKEELSRILPGSVFLAEETDPKLKDTEKLWIIDPIDGTTNFVHGFPFVAISVALQISGELTHGFVYNPFMNEFFAATRNEGSFLNGKCIRVSKVQRLSEALLATGFAYNFKTASENNIRFFEHFQSKCHGIRRPGSAALDLCYVAKGVFDGFWEWYLNPWDVAAGILIVEEAGGKITDLYGIDHLFTSDNILVTNSALHNQMLQEFNELLIK
ncbi:MAG: inositol monophosphatase [Candidatus Cloacimonetes bacterium]|nr:inositol monophosphatase [Candidatus Cloacimonadota bacterium]